MLFHYFFWLLWLSTGRAQFSLGSEVSVLICSWHSKKHIHTYMSMLWVEDVTPTTAGLPHPS